jgi:hypothetical protein
VSKCIAAHTNLDPTYPGYVNFTRNDDGTVTVIVRGDPIKYDKDGPCASVKLSAADFDALLASAAKPPID